MADKDERQMSEEDGGLMRMSAVEIQQEYYEAVGDVDWELFEKSERKYLLQKIAIALCGPPKKEGNLVDDTSEIKLKGYELKDEEQTMVVFNKICEQEKYSHNNENILISVLRVVCVAPTEVIPFYKPHPDDYWLDLHVKKGKDVTICIFHIFAIRKCASPKNGKSCRIYIDHEGRVYKTWQAFLTENTFPKSVMVVPENGEYVGKFETGDDEETVPRVKLTVLATPALGVKARILSAADKASLVGNIGALLGVGVGAAAIPLAPVVAPVAFGVAGGIAAVTGIYGIVRSSIHLADRGQHEQSIGLENSESRASWLNITLSTAGLSFSAAGKLLAMAASSGTTEIRILINAFQVLKYTNLVTGFMGVANSLGDMIYKYYKYDETPTTMELFQFTSSALFFGLGVMSNQTAKDIVQDAQAKSINEMRDGLTSKLKRKMFDKAAAETRRLKGFVEGNQDVIRALRKIDNKNEFFSRLARMNKDMNKNKVRVSLSPDGKAVFNNQHKISITELANLGKQGRQQLFSSYGPAKVTSKNVPTRIYPSNSSAKASTTVSKDIALSVRPEDVIKITTFLLRLNQVDENFVASVLSQMSEDLHQAFMLLCAEVFLSLAEAELNILSGLGPDHMMKLVLFVFNQLKRQIPDCDYVNDSSMTIVMKEFFGSGGLKKDTILLLKERFLEWMSHERERPNNKDDLKKFAELLEKSYRSIKVGEVMKIGEHEIVIKESTIEALSDWFENYTQQKCDLFMNICLNVISMMSKKEVSDLRLVNTDEDLLMIVAKYFKANLPGMSEMLDSILVTSEVEINSLTAASLKSAIITWLGRQKLRPHVECKACLGICYA